MTRQSGTKSTGQRFSDAIVDAVWQKAKPHPQYSYLRKDACGATISRSDYADQSMFGWEIDHIRPVSKGGTDALSNLQPLQWENNRHKGDDWPDWNCKLTD